ncbi:MAG: response regulator [Ignavibacteriae bacterium]|nr:response regulator [Ignavibacteriota bacterium]MCB9205755.1 response regulator [Ignavibacteriales bacterium]MCB9209917.1 response regulator [Ignavibacteriales bacterium]MCB9219368.1 response regulator [Ignavibacteriales bacterium]MCB9260255.1 response regulator [Ignavibacteriales bacterium]
MQLNNKVKKILLVDDDIDLLEQNKLLLESKGIEVFTAESAEEGLEKFKEVKPDAAIIDLIMEQHDSGFVLCHKLKKTDIGKQIPIYILTSATYETGFKFSATTMEEQKWIKCDGIINKPVILDELLSKLNKFYE